MECFSRNPKATSSWLQQQRLSCCFSWPWTWLGARQLSISCQVLVWSLQLWLFLLWPGSCRLECRDLWGCVRGGYPWGFLAASSIASIPGWTQTTRSLSKALTEAGWVQSVCDLRQTTLMRFYWASPAVHFGLVPKTALCAAGPKAGSLTGQSPHHLCCHDLCELCPTNAGFSADIFMEFGVLAALGAWNCWWLVFYGCFYWFGRKPLFPFRFLSAGLCTE